MCEKWDDEDWLCPVWESLAIAITIIVALDYQVRAGSNRGLEPRRSFSAVALICLMSSHRAECILRFLGELCCRLYVLQLLRM